VATLRRSSFSMARPKHKNANHFVPVTTALTRPRFGTRGLRRLSRAVQLLVLVGEVEDGEVHAHGGLPQNRFYKRRLASDRGLGDDGVAGLSRQLSQVSRPVGPVPLPGVGRQDVGYHVGKRLLPANEGQPPSARYGDKPFLPALEEVDGPKPVLP